MGELTPEENRERLRRLDEETFMGAKWQFHGGRPEFEGAASLIKFKVARDVLLVNCDTQKNGKMTCKVEGEKPNYFMKKNINNIYISDSVQASMIHNPNKLSIIFEKKPICVYAYHGSDDYKQKNIICMSKELFRDTKYAKLENGP